MGVAEAYTQVQLVRLVPGLQTQAFFSSDSISEFFRFPFFKPFLKKTFYSNFHFRVSSKTVIKYFDGLVGFLFYFGLVLLLVCLRQNLTLQR